MELKGFIRIGSLPSDCEPSLSPQPAVSLDKGLLEANIIGLGETAHASSELHRLAADMIYALSIGSKKSVQVLLEAPDSTLQKASHKIAKGDRIELKDLGETYGVWQTQGMVDALNAMADINKREPGKISLEGFDIRQPVSEFALLSDAFKDVVLFKRFADLTYLKTFERNTMDPKLFASLKKDLTDLVAELRRIEEPLKTKGVKLQHAHQIIKKWSKVYLEVETGIPASFAIRDQGMFDLIEMRLEKNKQAVVWAHAAHLIYESRKVESQITFLSGLDVTGSLLKTKHGKDYKLVLLGAQKLECKKMGADGFVKFTAKAESLEASLNPGDLYRADDSAFSDSKPIRFAFTDGGGPEKESYPEIKLSQRQFDYILLAR